MATAMPTGKQNPEQKPLVPNEDRMKVIKGKEKKSKPSNEADDLEALKLVTQRFDSAKAFRKPYDNRWDRFYKLYRLVLTDKSSYPWRAKLFIPYIYSTIETVVPRISARKPQITVLPMESSDDVTAKLFEKLLDYQLDCTEFEKKAILWVKEMLIYGTAMVKVTWKKETAPSVTRKPKIAAGVEYGATTSEEERVSYDDPVIDVVDLYDVFLDPDATSIEDAKYIVHRQMLTLDQIKSNKAYKNLDKVKPFSAAYDEFKSARYAVTGQNPRAVANPVERAEILEYWENDRLITVCNRSIVLQNEKNPFYHKRKPFVMMVDTPIPHELYGVGEVEPLEHLQNELNDVRNQMMDSSKQSLAPVIVANRTADVNFDQLIAKPGAVWLTDDMNALRMEKMQGVSSEAINIEQTIKQDMQTTSGVTDYARGTSELGNLNDTATGLQIITEESNLRFRQKVKHFEDAMKQVAEMMVSLTQQFYTREHVVRIAGKDGLQYIPVKPEVIQQGSYDITIEAGSTLPLNRGAFEAKLEKLFTFVTSNPLIADLVDVPTMVQKVIDAMDIPGVKAKDIIKPPAPAQQLPEPPSLSGLGPEALQVPNNVPIPPEIRQAATGQAGNPLAALLG